MECYCVGIDFLEKNLPRRKLIPPSEIAKLSGWVVFRAGITSLEELKQDQRKSDPGKMKELGMTLGEIDIKIRDRIYMYKSRSQFQYGKFLGQDLQQGVLYTHVAEMLLVTDS